MRNIILTVMVTLFIQFFGCFAFASDPEWIDDFKAAKETATQENKDLLLNFIGSDWCGWCIKLEKEVFSQKAFKDEAPKHFILVELDFPRKKEQSEEIKNQNQELLSKYRIEGYPTIILTDAKGLPYARTGYRAGGPDKYLSHIVELRTIKDKRDKIFAEAERSQGEEKAKQFDEALNLLEGSGIKNLALYMETIDQIIKLDEDNNAGLKSKYKKQKVNYDVSERFEEIKKNLENSLSTAYEDALKGFEELTEKYKPMPEIKQNIYVEIANIYLEKKNNQDAFLENLVLAQKAAPDTEMGRQIAEYIKQISESQ